MLGGPCHRYTIEEDHGHPKIMVLPKLAVELWLLVGRFLLTQGDTWNILNILQNFLAACFLTEFIEISFKYFSSSTSSAKILEPQVKVVSRVGMCLASYKPVFKLLLWIGFLWPCVSWVLCVEQRHTQYAHHDFYDFDTAEYALCESPVSTPGLQLLNNPEDMAAYTWGTQNHKNAVFTVLNS